MKTPPPIPQSTATTPPTVKTCPKCGGSMSPGYPMERSGEYGGFKHLVTWINGPLKLNRVRRFGLFGQHVHMLDTANTTYGCIVGSKCEKCGFIELYAIDDPTKTPV